MGSPQGALLSVAVACAVIVLASLVPPSAGLDPSRVHAFYYVWYGTPEVDGRWQHWDHEVLPHWTREVNDQHSNIGKKFSPPDDIHAPFFPARGPYSSRDRSVVGEHLQEMAEAGIGVAVVSWWGQLSHAGTADTQGVQTDAALADIFAAAEAQRHVKLAFHLEPYPGRTADSVLSDVEYLLGRFGSSPALFRWEDRLPLFYVYDSYHVPAEDWARVLAPGGAHSVRGTPSDGVFIGLWLDGSDFLKLKEAHFDGAYPYFASRGSSYGATWSHWVLMSNILHQSNMLFFPSVGPGYNDTLIRPWNREAQRERAAGEYYRRAWETALACNADAVSITSFNEWGEGTQIERAQPKVRPDGTSYEDYGSGGPSLYLSLTAELSRGLQPLPEGHEEL